MAANGIQQPLLHGGGGGGPAGAIEQKPRNGVKRFRRCRTAPSSDPAASAEPRPRPTSPDNASNTASAKKVFESNRPSFRLVGLLLLAYLLAGTTAFYLVMDHMTGDRSASRALDALYFCVITMTTVGYGDLVPSSDAAKLLASAFAFAGVAVVGTFLSKSADYLVEKQESLLFRAVHANAGHPARAARLRAMEAANRTRYKLYASAVLLAASMASGTLFLWRVEGMRPVDAFYCVCATVTSLGYGDRSVTSRAGRAFAVVWVTVSTVVVALFFLYVAELYAERRQRELARWVVTRRTTSADLEAADMDWDRQVGAAEFVLFKLKELGKISQEEISEFLEEFDRLDADHSGTLSPSDLAAAQPTD